MRLLLSESILNSSLLMQSATDPVQDGFIGIQLLPPAATMTEDETRITARNKVVMIVKWKAEAGAIVFFTKWFVSSSSSKLLFYIIFLFKKK